MNKRMTEEEFSKLYDKVVQYNVENYPNVMHDVQLTSKISTNCHKKFISDEDNGFEYYSKYARISAFIRSKYMALVNNDKSVKARYGRSQGVCTLLEDLMMELNKIDA